LQALSPTLPVQSNKKNKTKIKVKGNKILSQFHKTNSIVDSVMPGNGAKNLTTTASARVVVV